jgi:hypothetical protein
MPQWGRPPGAEAGVGRYYEGVDDVYRFQEVDGDGDNNGVLLDHGPRQVPTGQHPSPDELYFNNTDLPWERRASALDDMAGYDFDEDGYFDDFGEAVSFAEYEELLFQRVIDKIRIARAAGNPDVQLSPEEIEAYQSKVYGTKASMHPVRPSSRPASNSTLNDAATVVSAMTTNPSGNLKSRSKKSQQRTSLFSSKPKKEKPSSRKRAPSDVSGGSSPIAPGFVVPGSDGRQMYTPINPYQGSLTRDFEPPLQPTSRSVSGSSYTLHPSQAVPGAFPGAFTPLQSHRPATPPRQGRTYSHQSQEGRPRSSSIESAKLVPFPIEPYQYHTFSPSSSSQPSPQLQYTRRPSAAPSEASYTSMPRRVPVPAHRAANAQGPYSVPTTPSASGSTAGVVGMDEVQTPTVAQVVPQAVPVQSGQAGTSGKDNERKRKGGKSRKK